MSEPLVGVIMGSRSDWDVMKNAVDTLESLGIPHEVRVMSAHRTPGVVMQYASDAEERGLGVIIAAAGGAAHLAGVVAAHTILPVLGVPMSSGLNGLDSLLSTVQMPRGVPVGTLAIGRSGAVNSALLAAQILGASYPDIREAVRRDRATRSQAVLDDPDPRLPAP
jgi:5-(carboxyamino)imidazole ribonucleotide mutase